MTINPHPYVLTVAAEERHREVLALIARERRARQAAAHPGTAQYGTVHSAALSVAKVLAQLFAATRQGTFSLRSIELSYQ